MDYLVIFGLLMCALAVGVVSFLLGYWIGFERGEDSGAFHFAMLSRRGEFDDEEDDDD